MCFQGCHNLVYLWHNTILVAYRRRKMESNERANDINITLAEIFREKGEQVEICPGNFGR